MTASLSAAGATKSFHICGVPFDRIAPMFISQLPCENHS